ncbi:monooxygenase [Nostoc flagelliforme FACHB-838]|uniref:Monooxygenase n=1 Tax=Nostoc flagelliforme FACHB-838 TaxID=2692904 RepID=A0ABR8E1K2_9NOSO|nr:monooxygenase [Nostoc flagelliforme]MBD2535459.1 monooxygenase [Nostoc flagelliforme FACHB-838]
MVNTTKAKNDIYNTHAVVIGGSIAGLLSATVLAEFFSKVTIVDSDEFSDQPIPRKGVAQSVQPHVLLVKGYRIIEELFPGIGEELQFNGALPIDWAQEFFRLVPNVGWGAIAASPSEFISYTCSRPLLEWTIRKRVTQLGNVYWLQKHRATGLVCNNEKKITGVLLHPAGATEEKLEEASLVIDASGRHSSAPKWLEKLKFSCPPESIVDPHLGYATRRYKKVEDLAFKGKVMLIPQVPPNNKRLGYLARVEDGEWIATLGGYGRDFPPVDEQGFLEFASSLPSSKFYEFIKDAEPISPIYAYRVNANRLRHYEKIELPLGFLALGDAVCALCPVYGQGLTVSSLAVLVLRSCLKKQKNWSKDGYFLSSKFQNELAKSNFPHWNVATIQDSAFPSTFPSIQKRGLLHKFTQWYSQKFILGTVSFPEMNILFLQVTNLVISPLKLFSPRAIYYTLTNKS